MPSRTRHARRAGILPQKELILIIFNTMTAAATVWGKDSPPRLPMGDASQKLTEDGTSEGLSLRARVSSLDQSFPSPQINSIKILFKSARCTHSPSILNTLVAQPPPRMTHLTLGRQLRMTCPASYSWPASLHHHPYFAEGQREPRGEGRQLSGRSSEEQALRRRPCRRPGLSPEATLTPSE